MLANLSHSELFWTVLDILGLFWVYLECFGPFWGILGRYRLFRTPMGYYRLFWASLDWFWPYSKILGWETDMADTWMAEARLADKIWKLIIFYGKKHWKQVKTVDTESRSKLLDHHPHVLIYFRTIPEHIRQLESFPAISGLFGQIWYHFRPFWLCLDHFVFFGLIQAPLHHYGWFWSILDRFGSCQTILDYFRPIEVQGH